MTELRDAAGAAHTHWMEAVDHDDDEAFVYAPVFQRLMKELGTALIAAPAACEHSPEAVQYYERGNVAVCRACGASAQFHNSKRGDRDQGIGYRWGQPYRTEPPSDLRTLVALAASWRVRRISQEECAAELEAALKGQADTPLVEYGRKS